MIRFILLVLVVAILSPPCRLLLAAAQSDAIIGDCSKVQQVADNLGSYPVEIGFTSTLDHNGTGPNGYLLVEIVYAGHGWVAWGFSSSGEMAPGFSVVGTPEATNRITVYSMPQRDLSTFETLDSSTLKNPRVTQNSTHTVLRFKKRLIESTLFDVSIDGQGKNNFIVAWGDSNEFGYHGYTQKIKIPFELQHCINGPEDGSPSKQSIAVSSLPSTQKLFTAHGLFAAAAWSIFAPLAIGASLLRRVFIASQVPNMWFRIHMSVNMIVFIFTTMAFTFAVRAISMSNGARHFKDVKHRKTGLFIMILVFVQAISGLLRPQLPHPKAVDDHRNDQDDLEHDVVAEPSSSTTTPSKSIARVAFEILHRLLGFALLFFAWYQVQSGLKLYAMYYDKTELTGVFWGVTGCIAGLLFIFYVLHFKYC